MSHQPRFGLLTVLLSLILANSLPGMVCAERAWSGSIHIIDCHLMFRFGGYEYGFLEDLKYVDIDLTGAGSKGDADLELVPDDDNPLQVTFPGKVRIAVDREKAECVKIRFVRKSRYARKWRIHADDVAKILKGKKRN